MNQTFQYKRVTNCLQDSIKCIFPLLLFHFHICILDGENSISKVSKNSENGSFKWNCISECNRTFANHIKVFDFWKFHFHRENYSINLSKFNFRFHFSNDFFWLIIFTCFFLLLPFVFSDILCGVKWLSHVHNDIFH